MQYKKTMYIITHFHCFVEIFFQTTFHISAQFSSRFFRVIDLPKALMKNPWLLRWTHRLTFERCPKPPRFRAFAASRNFQIQQTTFHIDFFLSSSTAILLRTYTCAIFSLYYKLDMRKMRICCILQLLKIFSVHYSSLFFNHFTSTICIAEIFALFCRNTAYRLTPIPKSSRPKKGLFLVEFAWNSKIFTLFSLGKLLGFQSLDLNFRKHQPPFSTWFSAHIFFFTNFLFYQ